MPKTLDISSRQELISRLVEARTQTDHLFQTIHPDAFFDRPIPERHRLIFYFGHLEAFDWNMIGRQGLGRDPIHNKYDQLFAFGIDPINEGFPTDKISDWPSIDEVNQYRMQVREEIDKSLSTILYSDQHFPLIDENQIINVAIEHRQMHAETLCYLLHQLPLEKKYAPKHPAAEKKAGEYKKKMMDIPAGMATLGQKSARKVFGWDNEFEEHQVYVPKFRIDTYNVTNGDFLKFIQNGGYEDPTLWTTEGWQWKTKNHITHPLFWAKEGMRWKYNTMFSEIPLPLLWPVYVSHAEASAYARMKNQSLPTEAQWHRAAYGTSSSTERQYPWGDQPPNAHHGNFNFQSWDPTPVGSYPQGNSFFNVADMLGNGWEWTSTEFNPFPGFQSFSFYPGYSSNFFDGKHYILKGGSPRTSSNMLRRSYRNWFQPHYPYLYASFRCVENF